MMSMMLVLATLAVLVGLGACAKYPVVVGGNGMSAPAPTAAAPAPTR